MSCSAPTDPRPERDTGAAAQHRRLRHPPAADEERHYGWVEGALERLCLERGGLIDTVQDAVETVHGRTADAIESAGRRVAKAAERMRPGGAS